MKFVAHVALAPRGADPRTPPMVRGTRRPLTGRVRAARTAAHKSSKLWTRSKVVVHRAGVSTWLDLGRPPDLGEVAGDCGLGFSITKRALLIADLGAATGYGAMNEFKVRLGFIRFDRDAL